MTIDGRVERPLRFDESRRRIAEGSRWLPGGASSDWRMGAGAVVVDRADGAILHDVDGNRLIDYWCGAGPIILGHNHPVVSEAVHRRIDRGVQLAAETQDEYEAARLMTELVPCAEMARFANTGTEAVQLALRIARGATGRDVVVKFEGHYHGWMDSMFVGIPVRGRPGPTVQAGSDAVSLGIDPAAIRNTVVLPPNDLALVASRLEARDVAAVIIEPLCRGYIAPAPGFLEGLRAICTRTGTVLIFDEIVTGFRAGPGGAQELLGVTPDLATFAKALANGYPISAVAGRADLLRQIGGGPVVHPGTYNGNALSSAAAAATLGVLQEGGAYEQIERAGGRLMGAFADILEEHGIPSAVQGVPGSFNLNLGLGGPVRSWAETQVGDDQRAMRLTSALMERGVRAMGGGHWYVSAAHTDELVDETVAAFEDAVRSIA